MKSLLLVLLMGSVAAAGDYLLVVPSEKEVISACSMPVPTVQQLTVVQSAPVVKTVVRRPLLRRRVVTRYPTQYFSTYSGGGIRRVTMPSYGMRSYGMRSYGGNYSMGACSSGSG